MSGPSLHSMDMWIDTNISQIPFCATLSSGSSQACRDLFRNHSSVELTPRFLRKMMCFNDVTVPDYFHSEATNLTSDFVHQGREGGLRFATGVCTCDPLWGLVGKDCTETPLGIALLVFLTAIAIWILYLFGRFIVLYKSGEFKSSRKKSLAIISMVQFVGHILWLASTRWFQGVTSNSSLQSIFRVLGVGVVTLSIFLFLCGLLLDTTEFIRKGLQLRKGNKKNVLRLIRLERFFKLMPILMVILSLVLMKDLQIAAAVNVAGILIVACAFTVAIRALDSQVRRLIPESHVATESHILNGMESTVHLESASQRLRGMARRLQVYVLAVVLAGIMYTSLYSTKSAKLGILPSVFFGIFQVTESFIPFVALEAFKITNMKIMGTKLKYVKGTKPSKIKHSRLASISSVESSDCGTLGS